MDRPFVLGTAQLGSAYGVNNHDGKPAYETARDIVGTAWQLGVRQFDTARAYGDAEEILGRVFQELALSDGLEVHTKWNLNEVPDAQTVEALFAETLERLQMNFVDTLYAHEFEGFDAATDEVKAAIGERISAGQLGHFAVSVYDPEQAFAAIEDELVSAVQIMGNAFDRRFEDSGFIAAAKEKNVRVFVRSLYLQGLLVMSPEKIPDRLDFTRDAVAAWRAFCAEREIAPEVFALQYASLKGWGTPVIGCDSADQVLENVRLLGEAPAVSREALPLWESSEAAQVDGRIFDPRQWPSAT